MRKALAFIFLTLACCMLPDASPAAVAFDASATATEAGQDNSISLSINTSGSNRAVLCAVHFAPDTDTVSGITHNGVALSQSAVGRICTNGYCVDLWRLVAQATGSQTVAATMSGSNSNKSLTCISLTGVDQTTPLGTGASFSNTSDPMSATITVPANGLGLAFCTNNENGGTFTPGKDQTEPFADFADTDGNFQSMASYTSSTGSVSMTFSNGTGNYGACIALPINPAAAVVRKRVSAMFFE